ncbi:SpoIVB peptidase [Gorillibacterium sp. sgz5001074]|uniref:SpoIVB peptidase n=1 Tax=Gorillibacterium sp. sgz5001074 TaxID=3446695 RepID=UPI003F67B628
MNTVIRKRLVGLIIAFLICLISFSAPFQCFARFPDELRIFSGQDKDLQLSMPVIGQISVKNPGILSVNGSSQPTFQANLKEPIRIHTSETGQTEMMVKLGKIPLKSVKVKVLPDLKVIPGGQTIGVKLKSAGVLVVGHHLVAINEENKVSPGEEAKVQVGDLILSIDGKKLQDVNQMSEMVSKAGENGKPLDLEIKRNKDIVHIQLSPAYDKNDKAYRLGLYIRDSAAGVGTLTFYAPDQHVYGALGHVITDMDTQTPIEVGSGEIVHSNVTSISKSQNGEPGEKRAILREKVIGNIEKNTPFGIFGRMPAAPEQGLAKEAIPVAFSEEVKEGPAEIYTVVGGQKVEKFSIEITHVSKQDYPATKGMIIKITDPKLLEKTGGIVQGMSGSPIVQNGKMIGAVTHVFVNDPSSGYGCFIEWMLKDAGVLEDENAQELKAS